MHNSSLFAISEGIISDSEALILPRFRMVFAINAWRFPSRFPKYMPIPVSHRHRQTCRNEPLCRLGKAVMVTVRFMGNTASTLVGANRIWRCPRWPGLPPPFRKPFEPVRRRGFWYGESDEDGLDEVVEFWFNRASQLSTRSWSRPRKGHHSRPKIEKFTPEPFQTFSKVSIGGVWLQCLALAKA